MLALRSLQSKPTSSSSLSLSHISSLVAAATKPCKLSKDRRRALEEFCGQVGCQQATALRPPHRLPRPISCLAPTHQQLGKLQVQSAQAVSVGTSDGWGELALQGTRRGE